MAVHPLPEIALQEEVQLVEKAKQGDSLAFGSLVEPWRKPLFGYIYRMVMLRQDAEDLLQDVLLRVLEGIRTYRGEARFKSWLFGIATHVCLDHLRAKKRWRVEAQLIGEKEATADPQQVEGLTALMRQPGFSFEIREHIAFCFSCIARTLLAGRTGRTDAERSSGIHRAGSGRDSGRFRAGVPPPAFGGAREDDRGLRRALRADQQNGTVLSVQRPAANRQRRASRREPRAD